MSASAWQSYFECLKEGSIAIPEIRTFLCGPGRAGKTSLQRSLVNEKFKEDSDSTVGMELSRACCTVGKDSVWKRTSDDKQREMMVANLLARNAVNDGGLLSPIEAFKRQVLPIEHHRVAATERKRGAQTFHDPPPAVVAEKEEKIHAAAKSSPARNGIPVMQSTQNVDWALNAQEAKHPHSHQAQAPVLSNAKPVEPQHQVASGSSPVGAQAQTRRDSRTQQQQHQGRQHKHRLQQRPTPQMQGPQREQHQPAPWQEQRQRQLQVNNDLQQQRRLQEPQGQQEQEQQQPQQAQEQHMMPANHSPFQQAATAGHEVNLQAKHKKSAARETSSTAPTMTATTDAAQLRPENAHARLTAPTPGAYHLPASLERMASSSPDQEQDLRFPANHPSLRTAASTVWHSKVSHSHSYTVAGRKTVNPNEVQAKERMEHKSDCLSGAENVDVGHTPSKPSPRKMLPKAVDRSAATHAINAADDLVSGLRTKVNVFAEVGLDDLSFVTMWDFGGQEAFAVVQHLLMSYARSAYGVVFNASLQLDDPIHNTFREDGKEHELQRAKGSLPTNFEMMAEWLDVLHHILHLSKCNSSKVLLYLIGCQIDQIKPLAERKTRLGEIEREIRRRIKGKPYEHDIDGIVFVDNTLSGMSGHTTDPGVARLRRDLVRNMRSHASMQMPLPLRWLRFTIAMKSLAEKHSSPVVPLTAVKEIAASVCSLHFEHEADDLLSFHHHLGHILYFSSNEKLKESVVVDVAWLVKVISLLFAPPSVKSELEIHRDFREAYRLLFNRGLLLESLAEHIWECYCPKHAEHLKLPDQREFVFALMEEFALLVTAHDSVVIEVQHSPTERLYWVPALAGLEVTEVEEEEAFLNPEKGSTHASTRRSPHAFLHLSHGQQLPRPLFWRVVAHCLQHFRDVMFLERAQPKLNRSSVRLMCDSCHWLLLRRYQRGLQITVEREVQNGRFTRSDKDQLAAKCQQMLTFTKESLRSQAGETFADLEWCVSVRCRCNHDKEECDQHGRVRCPFADCHHFVPLDQPRCEKDGSRKQDVGSATFYWRPVSTQYQLINRSLD